MWRSGFPNLALKHVRHISAFRATNNPTIRRILAKPKMNSYAPSLFRPRRPFLIGQTGNITPTQSRLMIHRRLNEDLDLALGRA